MRTREKRASRCLVALVLVALVSTPGVTAHPHFNKTITVSLGGVEATIAYNTTPANEEHARSAAVGSFVTPRRPTLTLSGDLSAGSLTIPAGEYTIGVVKNSDSDWSMALHPGRIGRGQSPDSSSLIKLDSMFSSSAGTAHHMLIDISPGDGRLEGKAVLTLHFGTMFLAAALS